MRRFVTTFGTLSGVVGCGKGVEVSDPGTEVLVVVAATELFQTTALWVKQTVPFSYTQVRRADNPRRLFPLRDTAGRSLTESCDHPCSGIVDQRATFPWKMTRLSRYINYTCSVEYSDKQSINPVSRLLQFGPSFNVVGFYSVLLLAR